LDDTLFLNLSFLAAKPQSFRGYPEEVSMFLGETHDLELFFQ
jgi:hypothetical protein